MFWKILSLWKDLKDFFLCKYYQITRKLNYPKQLIPKTAYFLSIDFDQLLKETDVQVIRRSDLNEEKTFNKLGLVREDVIETKRVPRLSLNMLGAHFLLDHTKFSPDGEGSKDWNGEKIYLSDYYKNYKELEVYTPIIFDAKELHQIPIPLKIDQQNPVAKKLGQALRIKPDAITKTYSFTGHSLIKHSPTKLNYWHAELILKNEDNDELVKTQNKFGQNAADYMLTHVLCVKGQRLPAHPLREIGKGHYQKK